MKFATKAEHDAAAVYLGNLNTVEFDLKLPQTGASGSRISWKSSDPRFLTDTGKVSRPRFGTGARDITLEAVFDDGVHTCTRSFVVHILEAENDIKILRVLTPEQTYVAGAKVYLPSALPVETVEGDICMQDVVWDQGALRSFAQCGKLEEQGTIAGTKVEVLLPVQVVAAMPKEQVKPRALEEVPLKDVRLLPGTPFYEAAERMKVFLLGVDPDQLLYSFRTAAGLDTLGAAPMTGWDSPDCQLRGHTTGHYLSAIALAYGTSGDAAFKERAAYLVQSLAQCQAAFAEKEGFHPGFLSAYSEEQFDQLEQLTRYPKIWAPYYTLHKILAGLLDVYEQTGLELALEVATKTGLWVYERLDRLDPELRKKMWSLYIAGEYGGINESLARLYQLTSDDRYLTASAMFDNDKLLIPCTVGIDALSGMHGNQHIPQMIGALRMYEASGTEKYLLAAEHFWQAVVAHHAYAIGGVGEGEMFRQADWIARTLSDKTAESCASYNMLKLTEGLFLRHAEPEYMAYAERTLFNHILSAAEHSTAGRTTYFMPLKGGFRKTFEDENSCCHGTGMESHFRTNGMIFARQDGVMRIEQWIDSTLQPEGLKITTTWLEDRLQMKVSFTQAYQGSVVIRVPQMPEGYQRFEGPFQVGDQLTVERPLQVTFEPAPDQPDLGVLHYGPYILAAISAEREPVQIDLKNLVQEQGEEAFSDGQYTLVPLFQITDENYHVYLRVKGA